MSEEEKKAIERLKAIDETVEEYDGNILREDIQTVSILIRKQQTELIKRKKLMSNIQNTLSAMMTELAEKNLELEKKDKIIDEMANNILKFRADTIVPANIEGIKQYFERKIEK